MNSRDNPIQRAVDWVFGYDFFISYSHRDGLGYPRRLKERLEQTGFKGFSGPNGVRARYRAAA